jgi:hypothetical protein
MNFKTKEKTFDPNALEDEPIPTYKEWLDDAAGFVFNHPGFFIAKGAIALVKHLWTREQLMIQLLLQKDIIQEHEVEEHFGVKAHTDASKEGIKQLTKTMMRAASQGQLPGPDGKSLDPDTVLVILNDILDLNNTGWTGHTLEIICEMFGEENLLSDYEKEVTVIKVLNTQRAKKRERQVENERLMKERAERDQEERERKVRIYLSMCRVAEKPLPSDDEQKQMLDGEVEIPKAA